MAIIRGQRHLKSSKEGQQQIYAHLLECTKQEEPIEIIKRFYHLFIKGTGYENSNIRAALEQIVNAQDAEIEFPFILNRCCHIIINRWQLDSEFKLAIPELVAQLGKTVPPGSTHSRTTRKLRTLIRDFQSTEQYVKLQRLARLIDLSPEGRVKANRVELVENSVGDLIQRYPYLHQHYLLSEDSSLEFEQTVKTIQAEIQDNYESELSQYVVNRVRLVETIRKYKAANKTKIPKKLVKAVKNPTLLSDRDLDRAFKHYLGKAEKGYTYRDLSLQFLAHTNQVKSFRSFKRDLFDYVISGVDSAYAKRKFTGQLEECLQGIMPDFDDHKINEFLLLRTYSYLFKFLVVDSKGNPEHLQYIDLITYLGATKTVGLLLKLVLACSKIKPYLENRFSILFSHYETVTEEGVPWLIESLENLQVAFSIHFGKADFSLIKIL